MTLIEAKIRADTPDSFPTDELRVAFDRLRKTIANGGVRNSERAMNKLEKRLCRLDAFIQTRGQ